jgi:hypothetical protein
MKSSASVISICKCKSSFIFTADDRCGAATGIFLDVKRCSLIVLFAGTGSFLNAPYLDEHGDPDGGGLK